MITWMNGQPVGQQQTTTRETKTAADVRTTARQLSEDNRRTRPTVIVRQRRSNSSCVHTGEIRQRVIKNKQKTQYSTTSAPYDRI